MSSFHSLHCSGLVFPFATIPFLTASISIDHNLLKLDILGHDDPTMIRMLQDMTGRDPLTLHCSGLVFPFATIPFLTASMILKDFSGSTPLLIR